ncbi:MAG: AAA family ATPase [Candidatus Thermoplasmatota archaeon]|nr:AAA family ATPase [Candidatus Thermoplasmatota archaeon]
MSELKLVRIDAESVLKNGGDELVARVTVSGHPGSGTSTLVEGLCEEYGWTKLNGGQLFRDMAKNHSMTLEEFGHYCEENEQVDKELDALLADTIVNPESPEIIESRLAGWWAYRETHDCHRIWLEVSEGIRASRIVSREGGTIQGQVPQIKERMESDKLRYLQYYDIDIDSMEPYTLVIDANDMDAGSVLSLVKMHLEGEN